MTAVTATKLTQKTCVDLTLQRLACSHFTWFF